MSNFAAFVARVGRHKVSFDYLDAHLRMSTKRITTMLARHTLPVSGPQTAQSWHWHMRTFAQACQQADLAGALQVRRPNPDAGPLPEGLHGAMQYLAQRDTLQWLRRLEKYIETPDCSPSEVLRFVMEELVLPGDCGCEAPVLNGDCTLEERWRHKNHAAFNSMVRELLLRDRKQRNRIRGAWRSDGQKEADSPLRIVPPEMYDYLNAMLSVSQRENPDITIWFGNELTPKDLALKA